jgi:hypothetical protein
MRTREKNATSSPEYGGDDAVCVYVCVCVCVCVWTRLNGGGRNERNAYHMGNCGVFILCSRVVSVLFSCKVMMLIQLSFRATREDHYTK